MCVLYLPSQEGPKLHQGTEFFYSLIVGDCGGVARLDIRVQHAAAALRKATGGSDLPHQRARWICASGYIAYRAEHEGRR